MSKNSGNNKNSYGSNSNDRILVVVTEVIVMLQVEIMSVDTVGIVERIELRINVKRIAEIVVDIIIMSEMNSGKEQE
ncbi:hypothetical protein PIROE2DRAFT_19284 [Piromyces sp. E2]|nr:hypothetical protein PIROE2DRAFT_19284 [Piromyces sp. E2]|eukprot:OUM56208.1 hypothetical protein PIROE2DRAFT_19284 [Piromyces sp. E2]